MSTDKTLLDQIDDLVASKTFNLDALEGIKKIKDSLKATLEERDALKTLCYELCETNIRKDEEIRRLTDHLTEQDKRLDAMHAVWEKKIAEASAAAYRDPMLSRIGHRVRIGHAGGCMIEFTKRLFHKEPDVMLMRKSPMPPGEFDIRLAHSYRVGSRRFVDHCGITVLLKGDGTTVGHSYFTHWEPL
jgi:hypothetical protein